MRASQIEAWALAVCDRVVAQAPLEDSRVELKAGWIEPFKAARRLAGHANAARGEAVLWVVGADEKRGILGVSASRLEDWLAQVSAQFDGLAPSVIDVVVPVGQTHVVALLFDTGRPPYVVRNPEYGREGGGAIALEVPWRDGTRVRSARREDLLRLLVPLQRLPLVELRAASCTAGRPSGRPEVLAWSFRATLYLVPQSAERVVVPFHRCELVLLPGAGPALPLALTLTVPREKIDFRELLRSGGGIPRNLSATMDSTESELVADGPGTVYLRADTEASAIDLDLLDAIGAEVRLRLAHEDQPVILPMRLVLRKRSGSGSEWAHGDS